MPADCYFIITDQNMFPILFGIAGVFILLSFFATQSDKWKRMYTELQFITSDEIMEMKKVNARQAAELLYLQKENSEMLEYKMKYKNSEYDLKHIEKLKFAASAGNVAILAAQGMTQAQIASLLGLSHTQVHTRCKKFRIKTCGILKREQRKNAAENERSR
ncbi:helix-turn-helix domain-containing protein [Desulfovibrio sp. ZJ200]|uniref:helix-turn-helix transcriptional regulator n=1 Tax=Desulfovibrio sp. ZJ200 TaxID=2709792 RepID=UPI0013EA7149|nr:helix-turn-helix domain-containing protein [Desulfovibrio sp. ZJ200]